MSAVLLLLACRQPAPQHAANHSTLADKAVHVSKTIIATDDAPTPIGPYSQATAAGDFIFVSGQVAKDAATGKLITDDIAAETRQVMENLKAILQAAGVGFDRVVKTTIFLTDMSYFAAVNNVYASYFSGNFPARETVAVKALPLGVNVEISMIALRAND